MIGLLRFNASKLIPRRRRLRIDHFKLLTSTPSVFVPDSTPLASFAQKMMGEEAEGPIAAIIRRKLNAEFEPSHLEIICESHMHNVPKGSEKHFRVQVVSQKFEGLSLIQRHRLVNQALAEELAGPVHALRIDAQPNSNFSGEPPVPSPPCLGGGKR